MARLSDYGITLDNLTNVSTVKIKGADFPAAFTMETMEYIADVYNGDYSIFEADMNEMVDKKAGTISTANLSPGDLKIMRALIYGMLRTGGLEEKPADIFKLLGMNGDVLQAYGVCMEIFSDQNFQVEDVKKSSQPQDFQKPKRKQKGRKKKRK